MPRLFAKPAERELVITRIFEAPREVVFKAWTDPSQAKKWWGPKDHPAIELEMDVRPKGAWRGCLRSIETGKELWHRGVFHEISPPERLVFTFAWDEEGERGLETLVTVTFSDQNGKTQMTFHHAPFQSIEERDGHQGGWTSTFDRLADYLGET
ncbi:polyketide cyclase [Beijerinckiaceae bacterium]|nr:polyketide cyclase [Beijerinckiaceae bacterium]